MNIEDTSRFANRRETSDSRQQWLDEVNTSYVAFDYHRSSRSTGFSDQLLPALFISHNSEPVGADKTSEEPGTPSEKPVEAKESRSFMMQLVEHVAAKYRTAPPNRFVQEIGTALDAALEANRESWPSDLIEKLIREYKSGSPEAVRFVNAAILFANPTEQVAGNSSRKESALPGGGRLKGGLGEGAGQGLTVEEHHYVPRLSWYRAQPAKSVVVSERSSGGPTERAGASEAGMQLPKFSTRVLNDAARDSLPEGMQFRTKEQVATHLQRVLDNVKGRDEKITDADYKEFQSFIEQIKTGNPHAIETANKLMGQNVELTTSKVVATESNKSVKDLVRDAQTPEERTARASERLLQNGTVRDLLVENGVDRDKARELEKDLVGSDKKKQEKAVAEIEKTYKSRGGYTQFLADFKGRAGAFAVVVSAAIPQFLDK